MKKIKLSIFSSGVGSNLLAIHKATMDKTFPGLIELVICNKICPAYELSNNLNYETKLISSLNNKKFETLAHNELIKHEIDLICLAGFMRILSPEFVLNWKNKILNIHPSILPLFPGLHTHNRVLSKGLKIHGSTVHVVNDKLDSGKILGQLAIPVKDADIKTMKDRIKKYENILYPEVIRKYIWTFIFKKDKIFKNKLINNNEIIFSY